MSDKTTLRGIPFSKINDSIVTFLKEKIKEKRAVIGLSGGIDSSLTAFFLSKAIDRSKILGLILPDSTSTPPEDIRDSINLANMLGIEWKLIYIDEIVSSYTKKFNSYDKRSLGNLKARIRMSILYFFANDLDALVVGTGDKSEIYLGYFTKYGDGGVDILPIGDLYKTEVRETAAYFGLPKDIVLKKSSPRLWPGQTAEDELGLTYEEADKILYEYLDLRVDKNELLMKYGDLAKRVLELIENSEHKRSLPPIPKIL